MLLLPCCCCLCLLYSYFRCIFYFYFRLLCSMIISAMLLCQTFSWMICIMMKMMNAHTILIMRSIDLCNLPSFCSKCDNILTSYEWYARANCWFSLLANRWSVIQVKKKMFFFLRLSSFIYRNCKSQELEFKMHWENLFYFTVHCWWFFFSLVLSRSIVCSFALSLA